MTDPTPLDQMMLILGVLSVAIYILFLITIIRFRKIHPFNSSFFSLSLGLGICDLQCLAANWVLRKFATFGWFYMDTLARRFSPILAKIHQVVSIQGSNQQFAAVAIVALNRFTALAYFNKHDLIWTPRFVRGALCLQVLVPLAVTFPVVITYDVSYQTDNITGDFTGSITYSNENVPVYLMMGSFLHLWLVNVLSAGLYSVAFWKVRKTFKPRQVQPQRPTLRMENRRFEIRFGLVGLSLSALLTIYGCLLFKMATAVAARDLFMLEAYGTAWSVVNDVFSWCNPWLCLCMSPTLRSHMWAALKCAPSPNQLTPTPRRRAKKRSDNRVVEA